MKVCKNCQRIFRDERDYLTGTTRWRQDDDKNLWFNCSCMSTLFVPQGRYDWYAPEKLLSPEARSVFDHLALRQVIPHLHSVVMTLESVLSREDSSIEEIANVLRFEPALTTEILRSANLLKRRENAGLRTLSHAISYVGRDKLRDLVILAAVKKIEFRTKNFTSEAFWRESFLIGTIAEVFASEFGHSHMAMDAYVTGCLLNVGKLVGAVCTADATDRIFDLCASTTTRWSAAETQLALPNHCVLGEIAGMFWAFPEFVTDSIMQHHSLSWRDDEDPLNAVVFLANEVKYILKGKEELVHKAMLAKCLKIIGIKKEELQGFMASLGRIEEMIEKIAGSQFPDGAYAS